MEAQRPAAGSSQPPASAASAAGDEIGRTGSQADGSSLEARGARRALRQGRHPLLLASDDELAGAAGGAVWGAVHAEQRAHHQLEADHPVRAREARAIHRAAVRRLSLSMSTEQASLLNSRCRGAGVKSLSLRSWREPRSLPAPALAPAPNRLFISIISSAKIYQEAPPLREQQRANHVGSTPAYHISTCARIMPGVISDPSGAAHTASPRIT